MEVFRKLLVQKTGRTDPDCIPVRRSHKHNIDAEVQLDTSPIVNGYRKLCWAIMIFAFVVRLAIRKIKFKDRAQSNINNKIS